MARTRDQIAEAAIGLFGERGYDATTLEEIAERADVHKRTLLRYFPTKAHLLLHYQYAALEEFSEAISQRGQKPTLEVWQEHVAAHAKTMSKRGRLANTRRFARNEPAIKPAYLAIQADYQALIAEHLERDLAARANASILAKVSAAALVGGNYAVGAMILEKEAYAELESAELEVVRLVRQHLLGGI